MSDPARNIPETLLWFKALADETRLRILNVLCRYELNVNELVLIMAMGQPRISRHLKILSASGLLGFRREGLWVFYSAVREGAARDFINSVRSFVASDPALRADLDMAAGLIEDRARKTRQFFNCIAEDWDKLSREVLGDFDLPATVCRRMPECTTAADLGCGTGHVLKAMLDKAKNVIGVDGSHRMLELARRRFVREADRVSLRIGELSHLPLRDGEAQFVSLNMVLHHIRRPVDILGEIRRILSAPGLLLLTDFQRHEDERMREEYEDYWLGFERETLCAYLADAGFAVLESAIARVERGLSLHIIVSEKAAYANSR
ncbi:MAG: metalloregulator ArsR/SmtB family transcription factor [Desulfovibrio sp.]|jgi:ArsR family transcriptional regulator|nr:metalloregulator ArsR/SmtB family transcription factor [Desulfovibrio sp.]